MATERTASVTWQGDLMSGSGTIESVGSGAFGPLDVTWASRAEDPNGRTSPEELIAAAHASCFSMALSNGLAKAGTAPENSGPAPPHVHHRAAGVNELHQRFGRSAQSSGSWLEPRGHPNHSLRPQRNCR